jgi:hypothetical protein
MDRILELLADVLIKEQLSIQDAKAAIQRMLFLVTCAEKRRVSRAFADSQDDPTAEGNSLGSRHCDH